MDPVELARYIAQYLSECCGCGGCCINCHPISLDNIDIKRLEKRFNVNRGEAIKRFVKYVDNKTCIKVDNPCMFLNKETLRCNIYEDRPNICRLHPFLSCSQRNSESFWIEKDCAAMSDFWNDKMKDHPAFAMIITMAYEDPEFMKAAEKVIKRLLKKKLEINKI